MSGRNCRWGRGVGCGFRCCGLCCCTILDRIVRVEEEGGGGREGRKSGRLGKEGLGEGGGERTKGL